jgi:TonB family protein
MKTLTASIPYGFQELRQVQQRYMMLAMLAAITIQMLVIGGYHLKEWFAATDDIRKPHAGPIIEILPVPPLNPINRGGMIPVIAANLGKGIPTPVLDAIVDTSKQYASQTDLSGEADLAFTKISGGLDIGTIIIPPNESDPLPNTWTRVEIEPMVISRAVPEYPEAAKHIGMEGSVVVQVLIDKNGKVKKTQLTKTSDDIFVESALEAAQRWTFTPALMQGKPVLVWMSIPFRFRLTGK